jgi:hypothetical protein
VAEAPCTVTIDVGVAPVGTGAPEGDRSQGVNGYVLNTITPETETTCIIFGRSAEITNWPIKGSRKNCAGAYTAYSAKTKR